MHPLTPVYLASLVGGAAAALTALTIARRRRRAFFTAAALFTVSAVLAMWTIGITHLPLAIGCLIAGLISGKPTSGNPQGPPPRRPRLRVGGVLLAAVIASLATASMLGGTVASETQEQEAPASVIATPPSDGHQPMDRHEPATPTYERESS